MFVATWLGRSERMMAAEMRASATKADSPETMDMITHLRFFLGYSVVETSRRGSSAMTSSCMDSEVLFVREFLKAIDNEFSEVRLEIERVQTLSEQKGTAELSQDMQYKTALLWRYRVFIEMYVRISIIVYGLPELSQDFIVSHFSNLNPKSFWLFSFKSSMHYLPKSLN